MPSNTHTCTAHGCTRARRADQLMCSTHWNMVPTQLQTRIYEAYRNKQGPEHRRLCNEARATVKSLEGAFPK